MKKLCLLFLLALTTFAACNKTTVKATSFTSSSAPVTLAVLGPADCEIVCALGGVSQILAVGEYCDYPPELGSTPVAVSNFAVNTELLLSLKPELVIADALVQNPDSVKQLEDLGFNVLVTNAQNFAQVYETIVQIGKAIGHESEADALVASMQSKIAAVQKNCEAKSAGTVYFEVSPLEYGLWTSGNNTFMNEIAQILNLSNIFNSVEGWAPVSQEQVISLNPQHIVTITMYTSDGTDPAYEISNRKGWESISAVQNNKVFLTDSNSISRPGPRLADAVEDLYKKIYR